MLRPLLLSAILLAPAATWAQTSAQTGMWIDASGAATLGGTPFGLDPSTRVSLGLWRGNYDDRMALGRSWGGGLALRYDARAGAPRLMPSVEVRRQLDLLIAGLRWRANAGPEWHGEQVGVGARIGGTAMLRARPTFGPFVDLEAGAAYVDGQVRPAVALGLGVATAFRLRDQQRRRERQTPEVAR